MPRLRDPDSLKDVCAQFRALLGTHAAELIGRSASVLHKAADPDDDYMLTTQQMLTLDEACAFRLGVTPFLDFQLRRAGSAKVRHVEPLSVAHLDAEVAMGKFAESLRQAVSGASAAGSSISANEACRIKQAVVKVMDELQDVLTSVSAASPQPAPAKKAAKGGR